MEECRELWRIVNSQGAPMRHLRTVFCSLAVLVLVGIGPSVASADTPPNATTESWGEARKLCLQMPNSSWCGALINAVSGKGKPISFPSSGDTLTDAINEAGFQAGVRGLIIANKRDRDGALYHTAYLPCLSLYSKVDIQVCNRDMAKIKARITSRAKAAIGDKKRFRHCKVSLAPVDDPEEIVKCLEKLDAILASCGMKKPCITDNFTAYSALLVYTVKADDKDRDGAFASRCQEQYQNLSGMGYREIWACVRGYLGLLDEASDRTSGN